MKHGRLALLASIAANFFAALSPVYGEDANTEGDDLMGCWAPGFPYSATVGACSRVIQSPKSQAIGPDELARSHYARAMAYKGLGKLDDAMADMNAAIAAVPTYEPGYEGRGEIYLAKKEFRKALDAFNDPHVFGSNLQVLGRAKALEGLGRKKEAIVEYEKLEGFNTVWDRQTANEALIRLGARTAPPVAPPAKDKAPAEPSSPSIGGDCLYCAFLP